MIKRVLFLGLTSFVISAQASVEVVNAVPGPGAESSVVMKATQEKAKKQDKTSINNPKFSQAEYDQVKKERASLEEKLKAAQAENVALKSQLSGLKKKNAKQQHELSQNLSQLRAQLQDAKKSLQKNSQQNQVSDVPKKHAAPAKETAKKDSVPVKPNKEHAHSKKSATGHLYSKAIGNINEGNLQQAVMNLQQYIRHNPQAKHTVDAAFYLGQTYAQMGKYDKANRFYAAVVQQAPKTSRAADALLKLAGLALQQGNKQLANKHLETVISDFKDSPQAKQAQAELEAIKSGV